MTKLVSSNEAILIAVRDVLKFIIILGVKLVLTKIIFLKLFINCNIRPFQTCNMNYFTKLFLYYQQGSKSLRQEMRL